MQAAVERHTAMLGGTCSGSPGVDTAGASTTVALRPNSCLGVLVEPPAAKKTRYYSMPTVLLFVARIGQMANHEHLNTCPRMTTHDNT